MRISLEGGKAIELAQGDITQESTDAIVTSANSSLMGGGGVDGAVHRAGGPAILDECKAIVARQGWLPDGQAVATTGGRLKARHVLHTVGPVYEDGMFGEPETLASSYRETTRLADAMGLTSLAFPSISTGVYGYPIEKAAPIALRTVAETLAGCESLKLVRFVLFDARTFAAYRDAAGLLDAP